jgi:hypothetical protein
MVTTITPGLGAGVRLELPEESEFPANGFLAAPDLAHIGARMRDEHEDLSGFTEVSVDYLWKKHGGEASGRPKLGAEIIVAGFWRYYCQADLIIWLAADHLRGRSPDVVRAVLFHHLCAIDVDPKTLAPKLRPADVNAFLAEIKTFGLWNDDLRTAKDVFVQAELIPAEES